MSDQNNLSRPTLSLGNENSPTSATVLQQMKIDSVSVKSVKKVPTFWIWSIFNLLFLPFGLVCCYFSYRVGQFKQQDRYEPASTWSKRTFVLNIITTVLMLGLILTIVMLRYDYNERLNVNAGNDTLVTTTIIPWQPGR